MEFIEFEKSVSPYKQHTTILHSHEYYELYFLLEGTRQFFIGNRMYVVDSNTLVVVPPFVLHKTDGGPYMRININISSNLLKPQYIEMLGEIQKHFAINLTPPFKDVILYLLNVGAEEFSENTANKRDISLAITETILFILSKNELITTDLSAVTVKNDSSSLILKIVSFLNGNYTRAITLEEICKTFFISKMSLCTKFKFYMHCTVNEYLTRLKLTKAKELLVNTDKSIEKIAAECGFSSANYFGLIFKKEIGLSPLNYRKK